MEKVELDVAEMVEETFEKHFGVTLDRLRELAEADKDGRCVVLPCKVGDTVYLPAWDCKHGVHWNCENEQHCMTAQACFKCQGKCDLHRAVIEKTVDSDLWLISEVCYGHFGKTVFLTRPEAEAAMKGGGE